MKNYRIAETLSYMQSYGPDAITTQDLLSIIIGNQDKAATLLDPYKNETSLFSTPNPGLSSIMGLSLDELKYFGLTKAEAARILSAIELGKRIATLGQADREHITSPGDAAQYLMDRMRYLKTEHFVTLLLNTKNRIISSRLVAIGSLTSAVVHPREVFATAVSAHASSILVSHNHPSGDPYPSTEDRSLTHALEEAGRILGIPLLDHIVIGDGRFWSFREHGEL